MASKCVLSTYIKYVTITDWFQYGKFGYDLLNESCDSMEHYKEAFIASIAKEPFTRTDEDLKIIYSNLRRLDVFHNLNDAPLRAICCTARFERHPANFVLFRQGQVATCWYILLSGCVFMDEQIYLPCGWFGKRNGLDYRRKNDCIVLQPAEMIVIDYPDVKHIKVNKGHMCSTENSGRLRNSLCTLSAAAIPSPSGTVTVSICSGADSATSNPSLPPPSRLYKTGKASPLSATESPISRSERKKHRSFRQERDDMCSSNVSGSGYASTYKSQVYLNGLNVDTDTRLKVRHKARKSNSVSNPNSSEFYTHLSSTASSSANEDDLHGLPEAAVDSEEDDESCPSYDSFHELKDSVRECLEKEPFERTADDICTLLDFMQHMSALATLPLSIKRQLCLKMVFAVVSEANTVVMQHNERIDAWSVIVNGQVEVVLPDGERIEYKLGDSFGVKPDLIPQYHVGVMRTLVDDCEFVLVEHRDYCNIMSTISEHIEQHSDGITGEIVSEIERRSVGNQMGQVLIKANRDKLIEHLVEERDTAVDAHYIEDFLLMYRVFINDPTMIFEKLMHWFAESNLRDKIARIVLLWVNNHFNDFECNGEMMQLLDRFEQALERDQMHSQQSLLNIACSVKSRTRNIVYSRSSRDQPLSLSILGGKENGSSGIFVSDVQRGSRAEKIGLKRGDQIIEVNGQSFKKISLIRALEVLRSNTHLSITVKSNLLGFKEMIARSERAVDVEDQCNAYRKGAEIRYTKHRAVSKQSESVQRGSVSCMIGMNPRTGASSFSYLPPSGMISSVGNKTSMMDKLLTMLKGLPSTLPDGPIAESKTLNPTRSNSLRASRSNPDIAGHSVGTSRISTMNIAQYYQPASSPCPEHVLKVYRADQSFKYLTIYKETTAQNVVQLALQEFGMSSDSGSLEWALCETTVTLDGVIKQKRLPDQMNNLAERIQLNSRYYLKNNSRSEPMVPDELAPEVLKEAETHLLQLNAQILAAQLTLQDFDVFSSIEPTEYVDNLFNLESKYGWPKLADFESLFNKEMWWVATEICREKGLQKRMKLIKKFIKVARYCRDFRNFNSMFAIMSGLEKPAVRRLHHTWERVPSKYTKMFEDVQHLVDPSRNMSKYRQHLAIVSQEPPVVPIYPILKKDLTFSHEGNPTYCEKLINFEKLRMIAKTIRSVTKLCSSPYEIGVMAQQSGGNDVSDALVNMNSFDGGAGTVSTMRKVGPNAMKTATQPRRKLYEQALMVRKVKSYLSNLNVVECETDLDQLSYECEPSYGSTNVTRRRAPSPSPSSLSSQSSTSDQHRISAPKFGVESPHAVQKMLSLAQNSRLKQGCSGNLILVSPLQSPLLPSKGVRLRNTPLPVRRVPSTSQHHSTVTTTSDVQPVDLNAESSSVTSLYVPRINMYNICLCAVPVNGGFIFQHGQNLGSMQFG
uniref:RasGEF domain-containing protein n=4 Tax=Wuchereria bancrofti TaxID=6293 RepID=A0AAF5PIC5_WUCBA